MEVSKCNFTVNIVIDMDSKNIIFFGGTGLIGNSVLNLLNKKESKIYAFSRQNLVNKFENVKEVIFNFDTLEADIELNNWDHVYICLGRRLKLWELIYIRKKDRENHFKIEHDYIIKILEKAKKLEEALKSIDLDKSVSTEVINDKVVVKINNEESKDIQDVVSKTITAIEDARNKSGNYDTDVLIGGINDEIKAIAMANQNNKALIDKIEKINKEGKEEKSKTEETKIKAKSAEDEFKVALKQEIGQGLTDVKREKDRVIITVGSAGAFRSGSAELTENAKKIMKKIAKVSEKGSGQINVSGHTDNIPLIFGGQYRDNWDLAAARASSVVQSISKSGDIPLDRLIAISYGEAKPLASNNDAAGRSKNRRIEIEIKY